MNKTIWRWIGLLALLAIAGALVRTIFAPPSVVFIVRHAEKGAVPLDDPHLTAAGQRRADALSHLLGTVGVFAIFTSEFQRTQETVVPIARKTGITPIVIKAADTNRLISAVAARKGSDILIAGHSNTIPKIVEGLGGGSVAPIAETEFDNLYVVIIPRWSKVTVLRLKYGDPTQ